MDAQDFEALGDGDLRHRQTIKWNHFDEDVLPLWVAEMDYPTAPAVHDALRDGVERELFGYPLFGDAALGEATAGWCSRRYGWDVRPEFVHDLPDVLKGVELAISHFTRAGSPVILPVPAYMPFFEVIRVAGRDIIEVPMVEAGGRWVLDPDAIRAAFDAGAGSLVLCNPYNPLGTAFTAEELRAVARLASEKGARVIADEIHAPLVYGRRHVPAASVSAQAAQAVITIMATSKAWNTPGLKCAQAVLSNERDQQIWDTLGMLRTHGASTLGIAASIAAYEKGEEWLDGLLGTLQERRDYVASELPHRIPGLRVNTPEATYMAWLDFTGVDLGGQDPMEFMLEHAKVALNPGEPFGPGGAGHARLNFATTADILDRAITAMAAAVATYQKEKA